MSCLQGVFPKLFGIVLIFVAEIPLFGEVIPVDDDEIPLEVLPPVSTEGEFAVPLREIEGALRVALVQFTVSEAMYADREAFAERLRGVLETAVTGGGAEFVVFPEYVNVFALLEEYTPALRRSDTLGQFVAAGGFREPVPAILRKEVQEDTAVIRRIWERLAREYRVWILAGTAFVEAGDGTVRNRSWLFSPAGRLVHYVDKSFLTPFERDLRLSPGAVAAADPFEIDGLSFGVTICRDSYFDAWEERYREVDVWLDIRANGEDWNEEVRRRFEGALPERVAETPVGLGLSTSLNGEFLELFWEGPAFITDDTGRRVYQSPEIDGDRIVIVPVVTENADGP
jgi:predicted amidohydrolase